jgi:hypothetical protein
MGSGEAPRSSRLDEALDGIDRWGSRSGLSAIGKIKWSQAIKRFGRNHPYLGSLTQGIAWGFLMFIILSIRSLGLDESRLAAICAAGALFAAAAFVYNHGIS